MNCWICGGRGERLLRLRTGGARDGRRLCRVCARRMFTFLGELKDEERAGRMAALWPPSATDPGSEDWRLEARKTFIGALSAALAQESPASRLEASLVLLDAGLWHQSAALLRGLPEDIAEGEKASDLLLTSILSRLLEPEVLAVAGREELASAIYPTA